MLAARIAQRYCDSAVEGLPRPPRSSFGHGAAGVAYFLLSHHAFTGDRAALDRAAAWVAQAESDMSAAGAFAGDPPVFPDRRAAPPSSVLFGEAGVWWVAAQVHGARGDQGGVERSAAELAALAATCPEDRLDVAAGAAGLLLAAAALVDLAPGRLVPVGDDLARRLERAID